MKFSKKTLILASCMILCITMTAFGTIAYLTDRESLANTFTVGNIDISLSETQVENGKIIYAIDTDNDGDFYDGDESGAVYLPEDEIPDDLKDNARIPNRVDSMSENAGSSYKAVPGMEYVKDPKVLVHGGSEESYVRMIVRISMTDLLKDILKVDDAGIPGELLGDWNTEKWEAVSNNPIHVDPVNGINTYEYRYKEPVSALDREVELDALFNTVKIPLGVTENNVEDFAQMTIWVEAHAIQTVSFDGDVDAAWAAFDGQNTPNNGNGNEGSGNEGNGDDDNTTENP